MALIESIKGERSALNVSEDVLRLLKGMQARGVNIACLETSVPVEAGLKRARACRGPQNPPLGPILLSNKNCRDAIVSTFNSGGSWDDVAEALNGAVPANIRFRTDEPKLRSWVSSLRKDICKADTTVSKRANLQAFFIWWLTQQK